MAETKLKLRQLQQDGASTNDYLKFNGSAWAPAAFTGVDGSGSAGRVAIWSDADTLTSDAELTYNSTTDVLTIDDLTIDGSNSTLYTTSGILQLKGTTSGTVGTILLSEVTGNAIVFSGGTSTATSGIINRITNSGAFSPTSGTGVHNWINIAPVVNQTGGANGITAALHIEPTLTSVADFRGIELTFDNSSAWGVYQSGATTRNYLQGPTGIGTSTLGSNALRVSGSTRIDLGSDATGDIFYRNSSGDLTRLAAVATGNALISGGVATAPSWGKIDLTAHITGDLPFSNLTQIAGLSVLGVTGNSTADVAAITAGTDHQVLRRSGTALAFGSVNLASTNAVTGTLPVGNGGTGAATFTNNRVLTGNGTSAIVDEANLTFDGTLLTTTGNQYTSGFFGVGVTGSSTNKVRIRGGGATSSTNTLYVENSTPTATLVIRDDTKITLTQTASVSATHDNLAKTSTLTSVGNSVTGVHDRYTSTSSNDGTVTGNSQYGLLYSHAISANTQSSGAYGMFSALANSSANATGQMTSMFFRTTENDDTTNLNNRMGCRGEVLFTGTGDRHTGIGLRADITATSTGRWATGYGVYAAVSDAIAPYGAEIVLTNNRGTGNTQRGIRIHNNVVGSGVVVDNAYGIELRSSATSSGVITNYYGIYQNTIPSGATNTYFLFGNQSGAANYLAGAVGVGVAPSTTTKLITKGTGATSSTNTALFENSSGTDILTIRDDGRVAIKNSSFGATLHVTGEGTTSSTTSLIVEKSDGTDVLVVRDDGRVGILDATPAYPLDVAGEAAMQHLYSNTAAPTNSLGGATIVGTGASCTVTGGDIGMNVALTTGTGVSAAGTIDTITFNVAYGTAPTAVAFPKNAATAAMFKNSELWLETTSTTIVIKSTNNLTSSTSYNFDIVVIGRVPS